MPHHLRLPVVVLALLCAASFNALAIEKITLWPTILFLRGQDLCQFQDAYGKSRNELAMQATGQLKELLYTGVASRDALDVLVVVDGLIDKNRAQAIQGQERHIPHPPKR